MKNISLRTVVIINIRRSKYKTNYGLLKKSYVIMFLYSTLTVLILITSNKDKKSRFCKFI